MKTQSGRSELLPNTHIIFSPRSHPQKDRLAQSRTVSVDSRKLRLRPKVDILEHPIFDLSLSCFVPCGLSFYEMCQLLRSEKEVEVSNLPVPRGQQMQECVARYNDSGPTFFHVLCIYEGA